MKKIVRCYVKKITEEKVVNKIDEESKKQTLYSYLHRINDFYCSNNIGFINKNKLELWKIT